MFKLLVHIFSTVCIVAASQNPVLAQQTYSSPIIRIVGGTVYLMNGDSVLIPALVKQDQQCVFLSLHTEKDTIGLDPGLSYEGRIRAFVLSDLLQSSGIWTSYSTPFRRNILTLQPFTDARLKEVEFYDSGDLEEFYDRLESRPKEDIVIIGHAITLPKIIHAMTNIELKTTIKEHDAAKLFIIERKDKNQGILHSFTYHGKMF